MYEGVKNHAAEIYPSRAADKGTLDRIFSVLINDSPEILCLDSSYSVSQDRYGNVIAFRPRYVMDKETEVKMQRKLFNEALEIISRCPDDGDYAREYFFHKVICERTAYSKNMDGRIIHSAYGALINGDAVCDGYSKAMALLLRMCGIECSVVTGVSYNGDTTGFHAWNIMKIHGVYTLSDLTWNDYKEYVRYDYFNVTDTEMRIDHRVVNSMDYPECSSLEVNWHLLNNLYIGKVSDYKLLSLVDSYVRFTAETEETISLRFRYPETYMRFKENFNRWFKASMEKFGYNFSYWVSPNDRQQCFSIKRIGG